MAISMMTGEIFCALRNNLRALQESIGGTRLFRFIEGDPLAFDRRAVSPTVRARFRAEQLSDLERSTPVAMLTSCLSALTIAMSMWNTPQADAARLWAAAICLLAGGIYARRIIAHRPDAAQASTNGMWRASVNALLHGSLWAALPYFFFELAPAPQQVIIASISIATLFGGAYAISMIPGAMIAHVMPIAMGCLMAIARANNPVFVVVFGIVAVYLIVMIGAAFSRAAAAARRCASEVAAQEGALRDELTQLPNRVAFREELTRAFARHARQGECFALMCFDLDGFKTVNDSLGHETGDAVLVETARRVRASTRDSDMVARLGGDEFALIAVDIRAVDDAVSIAERVVAAFRTPFEIDGRNLPVSISVGVAMAPDDGVDPDSLLRNADNAMYATKQAGRAGYTLFRDRFGFIAERNTIDAELERAFAKKELFMVFQPFVDVSTLKTTGFEALLRWRHPVRGVLSAAEIIPLFERAGQIDVVGAWALEESMMIAAKWPDHLRLSVNVSALQLRKASFKQRVIDALEKSAFDPRRLELELTESAMILDGQMAFEMLTSLRKLGICTALDDLGTGYSSLANLVGLPLDRLKIDRSFVANLETNPMCASVVRLSVELARQLSLQMTAEGVETRAQLDILRAFGCIEAQGYLFSQPRPESQLNHLFDSCAIMEWAEPALAPPPAAPEPQITTAIAG